ncbi:MAG: hypothetical protein KDB53_02630, partial [Planctomycetes bacterium]|nr:hypothetical protein [Planctomycetota bacterium]
IRVLHEVDYNRSVDRTGNKHDSLFELVSELADGPIAAGGNQRFAIDRLGGRKRYAGKIAASFPFTALTTESETSHESRYRLQPPGADVEILFCVRGDDRFPETAFASMLAKYIRELFMRRFNAYWSRQAPGISATAGYWQDGQRFLADLSRYRVLDEATRKRVVRRR